MPNSASYHMYPCGDHAVTIELGNKVNAAINQKVISLFSYLKDQSIHGVKDIIPAYHTLTIVYDTALLRKKITTTTVYEWVCGQIQKAIENCKMAIAKTPALIRIPVCYDLSLAPDLKILAAAHQIGIDEVIQWHTGKSYRVYMIGFLPGFAYMGSVHEKISTPRKASPRTLVPGGSVGIAGEQTGIYPFDSPGGWQLIGQTPIAIFNIHKTQPCLLQPGDEVTFYPISLTEFQKMKDHEPAHS
ncbi:MAG: 5-oxoprolinase subunit PxpB [Sediminibacterium sp.]|nr:5-oxoprolinase subunit PxpB [Sediminibacterium sp.]